MREEEDCEEEGEGVPLIARETSGSGEARDLRGDVLGCPRGTPRSLAEALWGAAHGKVGGKEVGAGEFGLARVLVDSATLPVAGVADPAVAVVVRGLAVMIVRKGAATTKTGVVCLEGASVESAEAVFHGRSAAVLGMIALEPAVVEYASARDAHRATVALAAGVDPVVEETNVVECAGRAVIHVDGSALVNGVSTLERDVLERENTARAGKNEAVTERRTTHSHGTVDDRLVPSLALERDRLAGACLRCRPAEYAFAQDDHIAARGCAERSARVVSCVGDGGAVFAGVGAIAAAVDEVAGSL